MIYNYQWVLFQKFVEEWAQKNKVDDTNFSDFALNIRKVQSLHKSKERQPKTLKIVQ